MITKERMLTMIPGTNLILRVVRYGPLIFALSLCMVPAGFSGSVRAQSDKAVPNSPSIKLRGEHLSLRNELEHAIRKAVGWLEKNQAEDGSWSDPQHPAVTALVLTGCMGEPEGALRESPPEWIQNGYEFLLDHVHPDGGIYASNLRNYNTSLSIMALLAANRAEYEPVILNARNYVVSQQNDFGEKGVMDRSLDGGIGYGGSRDHADLANTLSALEALYYSAPVVQDKPAGQVQKLNWEGVRRFIERCQNLPSHNPETWASDDPANHGGFVYYPGFSQAGVMELEEGEGRTALRSYGSISYAGLLSYIYADLEKDDPRVLAVLDWLQRNYTLEENPGMGFQGLYYYYHTMSKALATYGVDTLKTADGQKIDWRIDLAKRLLNLQHNEGFWVNTNGRWWEKDPALVTAYTILTIEYILGDL